MKDIEKTINLLSYINNPMSNESINVLYSANNIKFDRCELYNDFIKSLMLLVFDTYMGDDITDSTQQINHFKWCWDTNVSNFKEEGIDFTNIKLYEYFLEFMLEVYYPLTEKKEGEKGHKDILNLWNYVFDYRTPKSNSDIDTLIEVYRIFDKCFKKK